MESGKVYVISLGNNLVEGMTREQIIEAIAEATGETLTHIDYAFITKLQEQNKSAALKVWVGTNAEYNRIETPANDTLYIITDTNEYEDLEARITAAEGEIESLESSMTDAESDIEDLQENKAPKYQYSTTDLTAGTSDLETGTLYFVYEN